MDWKSSFTHVWPPKIVNTTYIYICIKLPTTRKKIINILKPIEKVERRVKRVYEVRWKERYKNSHNLNSLHFFFLAKESLVGIPKSVPCHLFCFPLCVENED